MKMICLLHKGFEEVEGITLIDLMRRAGYEVTTVSITDQREVEGSHQITVLADQVWDEELAASGDCLILPGGPGIGHVKQNSHVLNLVKKYAEKNKVLAAICAAPSVLENAGVLTGKNATCFPSVEPELKSAHLQHNDVAVDGNIITGRGVGAAIAMGLKMVEVFSGKDASEDLRKKIVYQI